MKKHMKRIIADLDRVIADVYTLGERIKSECGSEKGARIKLF
jgi:hypothetical protein